MSESWDGLLAIDKPAGPTSHDLVARVRKATGVRRVGHTGTLDPPATGLLMLVLGSATRLARFLPNEPKTYQGVLALGVATASDDLTGEVLRRHDGPLPAPEAVRDAAAARVGRQWQVPPTISARHVDGTRLYRWARRGVAVEAPPSLVVVERFDVTPTAAMHLWNYELVVSTGTYVRAAVRDLGAALGCGAAVATLRRSAIGPFRVEDAVILPEDRTALRVAAADRLIPLDAIPLDLPSIALRSPDETIGFAAGRSIAWPEWLTEAEALAAVRDEQGRLLGVGGLGAGTLSPRVVLPRGA